MKPEEVGPSLLAACARVPDVSSRHARRYPLAALLTLATAALLAGARSLYAISQWGWLQPEAVRQALGFAAPRITHLLATAFRRPLVISSNACQINAVYPTNIERLHDH